MYDWETLKNQISTGVLIRFARTQIKTKMKVSNAEICRFFLYMIHCKLKLLVLYTNTTWVSSKKTET